MSLCVCVRVCTRLYNTHIYGLRLLLTYCMDFFPVPCSSIRGDPEIGDHFSSISCSNPWGRMSSKGSFAFWESCLSAWFFFCFVVLFFFKAFNVSRFKLVCTPLKRWWNTTYLSLIIHFVGQNCCCKDGFLSALQGRTSDCTQLKLYVLHFSVSGRLL